MFPGLFTTMKKANRQYALKITRNTAEKAVTVHPVTLAPPDASPYRLKYPRPYYAESLQLFATRKEAEAARAAELIAADFSTKPDAEIISILRNDLDRVANFGITLAVLCRITNTPYETLVSYVNRGKTPNPRTAARFHILAEGFARVANSAVSLLPDSGGCGNPRKGRGGQSDIWTKQSRFRPHRNEDSRGKSA